MHFNLDEVLSCLELSLQIDYSHGEVNQLEPVIIRMLKNNNNKN